MNLGQALAMAQAQPLPRLDAQLLLLHVLGRPAHDRAWLLAHDTDVLDQTAWLAFERACTRRAAGEPLAYLVGHKDFFGLPLQVDPRVLVPRPDTETLVDWALELLDEPADSRTGPLRVADLGTGSGAIALALRHARDSLDVWAIDRSVDALAVARANAGHLGLPLTLVQGDWLQGLPVDFDLIVSNPPYIAAGDPHLADLRHEPMQALVAGTDGLDDLRSIVGQAGQHLRPGGWLLLEHGYDQAATVSGLLSWHGFEHVRSRKDLAGIQRCSGGQWPIAG